MKNLTSLFYQPLDQFEIIFLGNIKSLYINKNYLINLLDH